MRLFQHTKHNSIRPEDEVGLLDIIQFIGHNSKFVGLTTLGLSAITLSLSLIGPKQYHKQLTLAVTPNYVSLSNQVLPALEVSQVGALAVEFLNSSKLDQITASSQYNAEKQTVDLYLQSKDGNALTAVGPKVTSKLQTRFQKTLSQSIETTLVSNEIPLKRQQQILAQLEQQLAQTPPTDTARQQGLGAQRAATLVTITALEFDNNYLKESQKNMADFTAKVIPVKILSESKVQSTGSLGQTVVVAVIASFLVAVLAAILRDLVARLKDDLSKPKSDRSADV
jgi:hypothetical protein